MRAGQVTRVRSGAPGPSRRLAVLGFHKIGIAPPSHDSWFYVSPSAFTGHLRWLQASRWDVISGSDLLRGLRRPEILPERAALITFDDGYLSVWKDALPIPSSFGFPAVLFVSTGFIGRTNAFDEGIEPEEPMCDWSHLRELRDGKVSIQSHGITHTAWSKLDRVSRDREVAESKALLEGGIGQRVEMFSFPYGDAGDEEADSTAVLRRVGYRAAFLFGGAPMSTPIADPFRIDRIPVGPDTDLSEALEEG